MVDGRHGLAPAGVRNHGDGVCANYFGVVLLKYADDAAQARVLAHEVAHFLALQHVENRGVSGTVYPDPLADTQPGQGNLMENGTTLTADQAFAISRSALLQLL